MDFLDPRKRRQHRIRLLIGYGLVAIAVVLVVYLLLLQALGYGYDPKTGQVIRNGLIYVSTHPVSADVYANNQYQGQSSLKMTVPAGKYNFAIKSTGYRDWFATVNLEGGGITRLTYPLLIPQTLTTTDVRQYATAPTFVSGSPDRHWLVVLQPGSLNKYDVYDLRKTSPTVTTITVPASLFKQVAGPQSIKLVEWSTDNKHLLVQHNYNGGKEFIVINREEAANSYNVNSLLGSAPDDVMLRNKRFDRVYAYIAKTKSLLFINAANRQTTTVLRNVLNFKAYGNNTLLYTSQISKEAGKYSVNIWDGEKSYLLHNYPANTTYKLDMAGYGDDLYVAVAPTSTSKLYVFKNPMTIMKTSRIPNPFIALKIKNPQFISFSANGQFVMAQSGPSFAAYDFDTDLWHYFTLKDKIPLTSKAAWMDGNRLLLNIKDKLNVFDFNGGNQQQLVSSLTGMNGYFDGDYSRFYTVAPSTTEAKKFTVTKTLMVVP